MNPRRVVLRLALASLRFRAAASLATFVAVLVGCSLLIACGGLFETALSLDAQPQRLAAAPVVVGGSAGFKLPDEESEVVPYSERAGIPADRIAKIAAVPGVRQVVPDTTFAAVVVTGAGPQGAAAPSAGHGWDSAALAPYSLVDGAQPRATGQVVLDEASAAAAGVRAGGQVPIAVNGAAPRDFVVTGIVHADTAVPALFFSPADAQQFSVHPGTVDLAGVFPADGVDAGELAARIAEQVPGLTVLTGADRGAAEFPGIDGAQLPLILLAGVFGGMVLVVMALVVSATISLTVRQRQQELALLRATGAVPRQVHRMVLAETMVVAALGALAGLAGGRFVGTEIFGFTTGHGMLPPQLEFQQGIIAFGGGLVLSLAISFAAAWFAALPAARARPLQALAEAAIPPAKVGDVRRFGAKVLAGATVVLAVASLFTPVDITSAVCGAAVLTGSIAVALIGPELLAFVATRFGPLIRRVGGRDAVLAVINSRTRAVAFAAVLTPITLATAVALGNVYAETTQQRAIVDAYAGQLRADAVVTSGTGAVSPALAEAVRQAPGVGSVSPLVTSQGWIEEPYDGNGSDPGRLLGLDVRDANGVLATPVTSGSLGDLTGDTVALPEGVADDLDLKLGDGITLRLGDGAQAKVKIVALLDSPSGYPSIVLPAALLAPHTTPGVANRLLVRAADGQDADAVVSAVTTATANWPGAVVGGSDAVKESFAAIADMEAMIHYLLAVLAIAYAAIAAVNTLAVAVLSRRREFGVQRLAGARRGQVRSMLLIEGGILAVLGLVLGTAISLFTIIPMAISSGTIVPVGPVWVFLAVVAAVFLIVWPVTVLSARLAMRRSPIEAVTLPGQ
ncbi:FtsX-like permease family protein [Amycolatopsis sp. NPDC049691]|uniref:FtsX-like permease family protein n=1 Tax=Amycolatopsis sp. NPDC049691 TaxID=3155155 RepID=UPI00342B5727